MDQDDHKDGEKLPPSLALGTKFTSSGLLDDLDDDDDDEEKATHHQKGSAAATRAVSPPSTTTTTTKNTADFSALSRAVQISTASQKQQQQALHQTKSSVPPKTRQQQQQQQQQNTHRNVPRNLTMNSGSRVVFGGGNNSGDTTQGIHFSESNSSPQTIPRKPLTVRIQSSPIRAQRKPTVTPDARANLMASKLNYVMKSKAHDIQRRYQVGDYVLISNSQSQQHRVMVNPFGFPPGEGLSHEEQSGPYIYALATVKQIHFEEIKAYYTVTLVETGGEQRADVDFMQPLTDKRGEEAALRAATAPLEQIGIYTGIGTNAAYGRRGFCYFVTLPFLWIYGFFHGVAAACILPLFWVIFEFVRRQTKLLLNGKEPYVLRLRLTAINFLVLCSIWAMFIDQLRLTAAVPPSADETLAAISLSVWLVLVAELVLEVFVRPEDYGMLVNSEKAYAPTTVQYLNSFQLIVESISLMAYTTEFACIFTSSSCSDRMEYSLHNALLLGISGTSWMDGLFSHGYLAIIRLRVFGLVRHWKKMWIANTITNPKRSASRLFIPLNWQERTFYSDKRAVASYSEQKHNESSLANASTIGTALMVRNSYRALGIMWAITGLFPFIHSLVIKNMNLVTGRMTKQLQETNLIANDTGNQTCEYLWSSVYAWSTGVVTPNYRDDDIDPFVLTIEIEPYRCAFSEDMYATAASCYWHSMEFTSAYAGDDNWMDHTEFCNFWKYMPTTDINDVADYADIRVGSIVHSRAEATGLLRNDTTGEWRTTNFSVTATFNETYPISTSALASLLLQLCLLLLVLGGLSILRRDGEVLVLEPLRRMLRIVSRYAKNPLSQPKVRQRPSFKRKASDGRIRSLKGSSINSDTDSENSDDDDSQDVADDDLQLGSYETQQLINAVAKITDLLRKCWGVAGADIISTNLATREGALTEVFNPTVPGKSVYALFGFAAINGFDHALRSLAGDVMILINDIAAVLHDEVFRWSFGDSGQCNKNLGAAFLMVFRIGLVEEVVEKLKEATDVVFSANGTATRRRQRHLSSGSGSSGVSPHRYSRNVGPHGVSRRRESGTTMNAMSLSLQSLPGIAKFTDRAVIGMLKSFAGIYRDNKIRDWNSDFRLGAGVGAFSGVSMIYGMDAGWAVEGAVGSEYKIDATYLSPHVNMASRMMSASKIYGVTILVSQSVEELMSDVARTKLRHLDTVTVKGSQVRQRIYTYDAKAKGVDFFLYSRSEDQADYEADRYEPNIWNTDQDLRAMRKHVTDDFSKLYQEGLKAYIAGDWPKAIPKLERASKIMFETAHEEGYLDDEMEEIEGQHISNSEKAAAFEELQRENGDGPSQFLVHYMKSLGGKAPKGWAGWHPLTRKS